MTDNDGVRPATCRRRTLLKGTAALGASGAVGVAVTAGASADAPSADRSADWGDQAEPEPYEDYAVRRVSKDDGETYDEIQAAVNDAAPRDLVLIESGVYREAVQVNDTPRLTIRGTDRNEVVIDGDYGDYTGITVTADDVAVENLTLRRWKYGVYWVGVEGYRGSYLTAHHNTEYGIYAFNSGHGRFEHCHSSGCDDAGFYIGESQPANAVITDCVAEYNAMGYSGTNAGGNLVIRDSVWRHNMSGLVPNTLDSQDGAPQGHVDGGIRIENNEIYENNNLNAPAYEMGYPPSGNGITVAGGTGNDIVDNEIRDQAQYGIAIAPIVDDNFWRPRDNVVAGNDVRGSGRVDLALAFPAENNRFADNEFGDSRPAAIESRDGSRGDPWVTMQMIKDFYQTDVGDYHRGETADQPEPDAQPNMPDPAGPPRTTLGGR
jgi:hypothetical protein